MKGSLLFLATLLSCVLVCTGQQIGLSDQQALQAAEKAFVKGNWNPKIFGVLPVTSRGVTLDVLFPDPWREDVKEGIIKQFGKGPLTVVTYGRRPETLSTNGGESYCLLQFLVFSSSQVAVLDSRAHACPEDKLPDKSGTDLIPPKGVK